MRQSRASARRWFTVIALLALVVALSVLLIGVAAQSIAISLEPTIRIIGLAMQLLGIATAWHKIQGTRSKFGIAGIIGNIAKRAYRRLLTYRRRPVELTPEGGSLQIIGFQSEAEVWWEISNDVSSEENIRRLRENHMRLRRKHDTLEVRTGQQVATITSDLRGERDARSTAIENLEDKIKQVEVIPRLADRNSLQGFPDAEVI